MNRILFIALSMLATVAAAFPPEWATLQPIAPLEYRTYEWQNGSLLYTNLVAWYDFTETNDPYTGSNSGSNAVDYSVSNSPATVFIGTSSGATWVASSGPTSSYYSFDGGDNIRVAPGKVPTGTPNITIMAWATTTTLSSYAGIIGMGRTLPPGAFAIHRQGANAVVYVNQTTYKVTLTNAFTLNTWIHICGIYDTTNQYLYVNGCYIGKSTVNTVIANYPWFIGAYHQIADNAMWSGNIDDVRIYGIAASATEVTNIFNATKSSHPNPAW